MTTTALRVGVDVGGTFTDLVALGDGPPLVIKVPSTPDDPSRGVLEAIGAAAAALGIDEAEFLGRCERILHGSTVATNILLERSGARVGMLTTAGFRDSLEIRRGIRGNAWAHREPYPPVLVPRYLRVPVRGRIAADGSQSEPLETADVEAAMAVFREEGVESVAICLFNSFLDDHHEQAARAEIARVAPGMHATCSSGVAPIMGEYERSSTAVVSAYVAPKVRGYVERLDLTLRERGCTGKLMLTQNSGGSASAAAVAERPASLLLSGPAAGTGALEMFGEAIGSDALISMEIGGTSCDVMLFHEGRAELASEFDIGGYHVALSAVDIHTVGAGGGTLASVDAQGMLSVGPRGAGASPGPAAYGRGGDRPTVTDAQLVLGRLAPGPLGDAGASLDRALAERAVEQHVARPLGLPVTEAAAGIVKLMEQNLFHAVMKVSGERGHDPRRFALVAGGGAGPMHGAALGRMLGSPLVYVPRLSGVFCALGMLNTDIRHELSRVVLAPLDEGAAGAITEVVASLAADALAALADEGFEPTARSFAVELDLRYPGQVGTLRTPVGWQGGCDVAEARARFEALHDRHFGYARADAAIEVATVRVTGIGAVPRVALHDAAGERSGRSSAATRPVVFAGAGAPVDTPVHAGAALAPGDVLRGPCLIEEPTTTVVAGPGDVVEVDRFGNYRITFDDAGNPA